LLNGKVSVEQEGIYYTVAGMEKHMPISAGSSSVKELFALNLILKRTPMENLTLCMEEPEAHLHPSLQRSMALLLASIINHGGFAQITTHSDFFMNQVNNLLKLHHIRTTKDKDVFTSTQRESGIGEEHILSPDLTGAYYFEKVNGAVTVRNLEISPNGFPLSGFKQTYEQSVKQTRRLRDVLSDSND